MEHDEIKRITEELEELLMTEEKQEAPEAGCVSEAQVSKEAAASEECAAAAEDGNALPAAELLQESEGKLSEPLLESEGKLSEPPQESEENISEPLQISEEEASEPVKRRIGKAKRVRHASFHADITAGYGLGGQGLIRPCDGLIAAFAVPVVIMLIIFAQRGIFPFGEESFLRTDMYHQYAPFFSEFRYKLTHGGSLLYSWDVGMGVNFAALYAYYLASPLNWLILLCPKGLVIEFMTYMIVFKTGLCGLAMAWYLRRHCGTRDFGIAFFGIFYAMSGYMAAYSWNIMWLDCIILFPLIVFGLERLVKDGKGMVYCLTLGLSILSNYYISIMTCIFMVLYFAALLVLEQEMSWEKFIGRSAKFAWYSLLAGGLAAVVLLPEISALQMTASGDINFPKTVSQYFSIFDMIARHIGNVETEIGLDHWPNIYCGVAVLMFITLYLVQKRVPGKEKAVYVTMAVLFFASFSVNVLNFIWHGFHYPNSLPCRQSYIYIFLVLFMCYRAYMYLRDTSWKQMAAAFWGAFGFVILAQKLVTEEHFHFLVFYAAMLFLALYLGILYLYQKGVRYKNRALLLALFLVSMEAAVNMAVTSVTTTSRTAYKEDNEAVEKLAELVQPNETFYRMEKVTRKTKNDGAWMHFPSVSLFSSTANADLSELVKKLGCESSTNAYSITGATPLIDMLFAVKYGIYSEEAEVTPLRSFLAREDETFLYENTYTLPLGFWVPSDFEYRWNLDLSHPADVQNSLADCVGAEHVLETILDTETEGKKLSFWPEESGEYFAYINNKKIEKVTAATGSGTKTFNNVDRGYLLELGYCAAGEEVVLTPEGTTESLTADIYRFSERGLAEVYEKLSAGPWQLDSWTDTSLKGTISCEEGGLMMTTIPYDEGWTVLVDGVRQPSDKILDAFLAVRLAPGTHQIEMTYVPQGLRPGCLISGICVLILMLTAAVGRYVRKHRSEEAAE